MNDKNKDAAAKVGIWQRLNRPIRIPSWLSGLLFVSVVIFLVATNIRESAQLKKDWADPKRQPIQSIDAAKQLHSASQDLNLALDLVNTGELILKYLDTDSPNRVAALNALANAYVVDGKHAKAMPLYEESREILKRNLGPDHPDVAIIEQNMKVAIQIAAE